MINRKSKIKAELGYTSYGDLAAHKGSLSQIRDGAVQNIKTGVSTKLYVNIQAPIPSLKKQQNKSDEEKKVTRLTSTAELTLCKNTYRTVTTCTNYTEKWKEEYLSCNLEFRRLIGYITVIKIGFSIFLFSILLILCLLSNI